MNTDKRRVPVHKDEWVTECARLRMENANLRNRVAQLELELKRGATETEQELRFQNKVLSEQLSDMIDKSAFWREKVLGSRIAFWVIFGAFCVLAFLWLIGGAK